MFYYNINGENSIDPPEPEPNPNHPQIMWWRKPEILQTGADYEAGRAESHQLIARLPPHLGEKLLLGLCPGGRAGTWYLVFGTWYLVLGTWYLVLGILYLVLGAWYLVLGTWYLVVGSW